MCGKTKSIGKVTLLGPKDTMSSGAMLLFSRALGNILIIGSSHCAGWMDIDLRGYSFGFQDLELIPKSYGAKRAMLAPVGGTSTQRTCTKARENVLDISFDDLVTSLLATGEANDKCVFWVLGTKVLGYTTFPFVPKP